jgi:hypothetical protein
MICPFSGKLCRNCSPYIGRHYFLCYNPLYRGHFKNVKRVKAANARPVGAIYAKDFVMPKLKYNEALDPHAETYDTSIS